MRRTSCTALILAVTLGAASLLVACGSSDSGGSTTTGPKTIDRSRPDIVGTITAVTPFEPVTTDCTKPEDLPPDGAISNDDPPVCTDPDTDVLGTVLIEAEPGVQQGDKLSLTVTSDTVLDGTGVTRFADLETGQKVQGWTTGAIAESYPGQGTARALRVLG